MSIEIKFEKGPARPKRRVLAQPIHEPEPQPYKMPLSSLIICGLIGAVIFLTYKVGTSNNSTNDQIKALREQQEYDTWKAKEKRENDLHRIYGREWHNYK